MKGNLSIISIAILTCFTCTTILATKILRMHLTMAEQDCSWGKTLKEFYETPRKGNDVDKDASDTAQNTPSTGGGNSEVSDFNKQCRE